MQRRAICPEDTRGEKLAREPAFSQFGPIQSSAMLSVECLDPRELYDCVAWSVHQLAQRNASAAASIETPSTVRKPQLWTKRTISDQVQSVDFGFRIDVHRRWWAALALSWIAFAKRPINRTELLAALAAECEHRSSENFDRASTRLHRGVDEIELESTLSEFRIISNAGMRIQSREEAKTSLLHLGLNLDGTNKGPIHEMIAYTCLRCIERHRPASIFRPWAVIESFLDHRSPSGGLLPYATSFWHVHFRLAEHSCRRLSALLHRIIQLALTEDNENCRRDGPDAVQIINSGMWLCALHDFQSLGRTYLEMGAEFEEASWPYTSSLHVAASASSLKVLELILSRQPELDILDREGMTPLQVAVYNGNIGAVKMLLAAGSDVNKTIPGSGETALLIALRAGHDKIVALLLEKGADISAKSGFSEVAMDLALREGDCVIGKMIFDRAAGHSTSSNVERSATDVTSALHTLSLVEQDAPPPVEHAQYVLQESSRFRIDLRFR